MMVFKMERYILPALTEPGQRLAVGDCHLLGYDPRGRREWVPPSASGTRTVAATGRDAQDCEIWAGDVGQEQVQRRAA